MRKHKKYVYRGVDELPDEYWTKDFAEELLEAKTEPNEQGCLIWQGHKDQYGRGQFQKHHLGERYTITNAHRFIYQCWNGKRLTSKKEIVMHLCGVKDCCNPNHLVVGNHKQNAEHEKILHMNARYFQGGQAARSERKTQATIRYIKETRWSNRKIAQKVNFHPNTIARYRAKIAKGLL